MNFPDKISVDVLDANTNSPIENVAIVLTLFANRKNNYFVGPHITDSNGQVHFTKKNCENAISAAKAMFIMDYSGTLEDCKPKAEIALQPPERISIMIQQYKKAPAFWGIAFENPEKLFSDLSNVKNTSYQLTSIYLTEKEIETIPRIFLYLSTR